MHIAPIISDLSIILVCAGVVCLLFRWFKQPLVLGYIVAGVIASPHSTWFPIDASIENINVWAEIGSIFILFMLGLEFSFKKLFKTGSSVGITAIFELVSMLTIGYLLGQFMGWTQIESLFLGGMLTLSSSAIVTKTIEELNLKEAPFVKYAFGVLVIEDLIAMVMMVIFSTMGLADIFPAEQVMEVILKLLLFITIWLLTGILIIPSFFKLFKRHLNDETLMITSVGLCLLMVIITVKAGFSAGLGAFIMGSILAETTEVERIERSVHSLKNFFSAIFFVSVGMLIDPEILKAQYPTILLITVCFILGKMIFTSLGLFLTGRPLHTSLRLGFSLAQIGEMAFILAAIGVNLRLISDQIYPLIVSVSVITIFLTPSVMKIADPISHWIILKSPQGWRKRLLKGKDSSKAPTPSLWKSVLLRYISYTFVLVAIIHTLQELSVLYLLPFMSDISDRWSHWVTLLITLLLMAPFLRILLINRNNLHESYQRLWLLNRRNRLILGLMLLFRLLIVFYYIVSTLYRYYPFNQYVIGLLALLLLVVIFNSNSLLKYYFVLEQHFLMNLNQRQIEQARLSRGNRPTDRIARTAQEKWIDIQYHVTHLRVLPKSSFVGKTLIEINLRHQYRISVVRIKKKFLTINIPLGNCIIEQGDILIIMATLADLTQFIRQASYLSQDHKQSITLREYALKQKRERKVNRLISTAISIDDQSGLLGKTLKDSDISERTRSLLLGIERAGISMMNVSPDEIFQEGDILWVLAEKKQIVSLIERNILH